MDMINILTVFILAIFVGNEIITILYTPGHFKDSICFWNKKDDLLFTGDTMFVGRTGRTIGLKSNISDLYKTKGNITKPAAAGEGTPSKKFSFHTELSSVVIILNLASLRAVQTT